MGVRNSVLKLWTLSCLIAFSEQGFTDEPLLPENLNATTPLTTISTTISTTIPTTIQGGVGDGGGGGYTEQDWNVRAMEMLAIIQYAPDHFGLTADQVGQLKKAVEISYVKKTSEPIKIIGPDDQLTEKDAKFTLKPYPTITFHERWKDMDPIDQVSIQLHEYGGIIGLEKNLYVASAAFKEFLIDNYKKIHFARLGEYRVQPAQGGEIIQVASLQEILNEIYKGDYSSRLAAGNLPDPSIDQEKFKQLQKKLKLSLEVNCRGAARTATPENEELCNLLHSVDTQMNISNNPVIQGLQGPMKSMGILISRAECKFWGSKAVQQNTSAGKTLLKTLIHAIVYPVIQTIEGTKMFYEYYEQPLMTGYSLYDNNPVLVRTIEVIGTVPAIVANAWLGLFFDWAGTALGLVDTTAKTFGKNNLIDRSNECREPGMFQFE